MKLLNLKFIDVLNIKLHVFVNQQLSLNMPITQDSEFSFFFLIGCLSLWCKAVTRDNQINEFLFCFRLVSFFTQLKAVPQNYREKMHHVTLVKNPWIHLYYWNKYTLKLLVYLLSTSCSLLFFSVTLIFVWLLWRKCQLIHQSKLSWGSSQALFLGKSQWHLRGFFFVLLGGMFFWGRL